MNIFYLDVDPEYAAISMCNKHVVKMILESAQMLSTAHRILDGTKQILLVTALDKHGNEVTRKKTHWYLDDFDMNLNLYGTTHQNHPSSAWVRQSSTNYNWLNCHLYALMKEYSYRYGKTHKTQSIARYLTKPPINIPRGCFTPPPQAMPDDVKHESTVQAYRNYYIKYKNKMAEWKLREPPEWFTTT